MSDARLEAASQSRLDAIWDTWREYRDPGEVTVRIDDLITALQGESQPRNPLTEAEAGTILIKVGGDTLVALHPLDVDHTPGIRPRTKNVVLALLTLALNQIEED